MIRVCEGSGGKHVSLSVEATTGELLGLASVVSPDTESASEGLAGFLRSRSSAGVTDRYLRLVTDDSVDRVRSTLANPTSVRLCGDPCWIELEVVSSAGKEHLCAVLLTREQSAIVSLWTTRPGPGDYLLPNGQLVTGSADVPYRLVPIRWAEGVDGIAADGRLRFQCLDSSPYSHYLDSPYTYKVVLPETMKEQFPTGWARLSNCVDRQGSALDVHFPVQVVFDPAVPALSAAVDETVSVSLGMAEGSVVEVTPITEVSGSWRRGLFRFRHTIVRVIGATSMDMEKPVCRLPEGVLDILGVPNGEHVVIESLSRDGWTLRQRPMRALIERDQRIARLGGTIDVLELTGSVDIPTIALDLSTRNLLGVRRGDPVYVRPRFSSVLLEEFSALSTTILAALIGAVAANLSWLVAVLCALYVLLAVSTLWRRFR